MIKIVEKYFTQENFSKRESEALDLAVSKTRFKVQVTLFKGVIFDPDKVGSIIYKGVYKGRPAVLKLQGLRPETDEVDILLNFKKQNESKIIRLPELYSFQKWNEKNGFGFLISEYIPYPKIHPMPFAKDKQIKLFTDFYQEYRTKCIHKPFTKMEEETDSSQNFVLRRLDTWIKISNHKSVLKKLVSANEIGNLVGKYKSTMEKNLEGSLVFCHGHLSSKDILYNGRGFVLLSNLYWGYRPKLYDLVFDLHWCLEAINDKNYTYNDYIKLITRWLNNFYEIPVVKNDKQAMKNIHLMLLERTMGAVLIDTDSRNEMNVKIKHLLDIQIRFFDELIERIDKAIYLGVDKNSL